MITLTREEAQQVLDALNSCDETWVYDGEDEQIVDQYDHKLVAKAKELFNAKIAQPEPKNKALTHEENKAHNQKILDEFYKENAALYEPEPVAGYRWEEGRTPPSVTFTAPPQRNWQGLTDEEKNEITWGKTVYEILDLAEAKLKEKNTW